MYILFVLIFNAYERDVVNVCDSEELFWIHNLFGILDMCR